MALITLKKRSEFLAIRGGIRASTPSFLIEAKARPGDPPRHGARFGFTVTKKLGNAVTRNRVRRRIKAALAEMTGDLTLDGFDYVVVARSAALDRDYMDLKADAVRALTGIRKSALKPVQNKPCAPKSRSDGA